MPKKRIFTQEMIDDLYKMGDREYCKKWDITNPTIKKYRRANSIKSFIMQDGTIPHKFIDGVECKWCYVGHWEPITNFYNCKSNYDGIVRCCKSHCKENTKRLKDNKRGPNWKRKPNWIEHKFDKGVELKLCSTGKHWETIDKFGKCPSRHDGLRSVCKLHEKKSAKIYHSSEHGKEVVKAWKQTPTAKECNRRTWRKQKETKDNAMVSWDKKDEHFAYDLFNHQCAYCGFQIELLTLEFDHFVPIKLGGKTEPGNMVPCCYVCNHGSGGKFAKDALEWLTEKFGERIALLIYKDVKKKLSLARQVEDKNEN